VFNSNVTLKTHSYSESPRVTLFLNYLIFMVTCFVTLY